MLIAEDTYAGRVQHHQRAIVCRQAQPPRGKNPHDVRAGENQQVTGAVPQFGDDSIRAGAHVRRGFAGWTTIAKQPPARVGDDDLLRRRAFVGALVPFGEIGALLALDAETREHSGAERSLGWAGQDGREAPSREPGAKPTGS